MGSPTTINQVTVLANEYQSVINAFNTMMSAAAIFVTAANAISADPQFSIASTAFKNWGTTVLSQVSTFVQNTASPPAP